MHYSKIYKFVKDPADYKAVCDVILENYELIFEQYLYGQSISRYPSISMLDFTKICNNWKIINKKDLTSTDIDRLFYAVNFEEEDGEAASNSDNPDDELCRFEFFEIIVRIAKLKYENNKSGYTVAQSLSHLIEDFIQ